MTDWLLPFGWCAWMALILFATKYLVRKYLVRPKEFRCPYCKSLLPKELWKQFKEIRYGGFRGYFYCAKGRCHACKNEILFKDKHTHGMGIVTMAMFYFLPPLLAITLPPLLMGYCFGKLQVSRCPEVETLDNT